MEATWGDLLRRGAGERSLFEGEIGVEVDLGCLDAFVAEPQSNNGATTTKKVIDFCFKCVLEQLAGSLADQLFKHIIWRGDRCGRRQNLIPCRHGVTLLKLARVTESVDLQREVTPLLSPFQAARRRSISTRFNSSSVCQLAQPNRNLLLNYPAQGAQAE